MTKNEQYDPCCFIDDFFLVSDSHQLPCLDFHQFFSILSPLPPLHGIFNACGIGMNLCTRLQWVMKFIPLAMMWSWWGLCPAPSSLGLVLSSASTVQAYFVLRFPILRWVSPLLFIGILQSIASDLLFFSERLSLWAWIFHRLVSAKNIPFDVVDLWFLDSPSLLCLTFYCIGHLLPHIWPLLRLFVSS